MDSIRQQKISKLIQTEISILIQKELKHLCLNSLVTITMVRVTSDLSIARIYASVFGSNNKNAVIEGFNSSVSEVRFQLGKKLRHQLRHIPELHFHIDDSLDYIERIDKALKQ